MKFSKEEIVYVPIEKVIPYANNPRKNDDAVEYVQNSMKEFGFKNPIMLDKDNVIICGHTRLKAAQNLHYSEVPCVYCKDLTPEQVKAFRLADNKTAEKAVWDFDLLDDELDEIEEIDMGDFGFDISTESDEEVKEDDVPDVPEEPKAKCGDVYKLGRHTLMCGDSTSIDDIECLMSRGGTQEAQKANLLITDPPYNVDYVGKAKNHLKIENDSKTDDEFYEFLYDAFSNAYIAMNDGASFYCWSASKEFINFLDALRDSGLAVKQELIWNKNSMVLSRSDYQWKHEPCFYGWKDTAGHEWYGDRKQTTVIDWDRPTKSLLHPTMKPVGLFDYQIKNSSAKGDCVLDIFGGSGTTLMACEQDGRNAYIMEKDPKYVDVIIERWETATGMKAELINEKSDRRKAEEGNK